MTASKPSTSSYTLKPGRLHLGTVRATLVWGTALLVFALVGVVLTALSKRGDSFDPRLFYVVPLLSGFGIWYVSDMLGLKEDATFTVDKNGVTVPGFLLGSEKRVLIPPRSIVALWCTNDRATKELKGIFMELSSGERLSFGPHNFSVGLSTVLKSLMENLPNDAPFRSAGLPGTNFRFLVLISVVGLVAFGAVMLMVLSLK